MKKTIFSNQQGTTFAVAIADQYFQAYVNNDPPPYQRAKIYLSLPKFAQEGVYTRIMWCDREKKMEEPLNNYVLYLMDLAAANLKEIVFDKGFSNDVYIIVTGVVKRGIVYLRLRIIDENENLLCVWFTEYPEVNMSEAKMDKFIGSIMDATRESGMTMDMDDEIDASDYNVNQGGEEKNTHIQPPSPSSPTQKGSSMGNNQPDDQVRYQKRSGYQEYREEQDRKKPTTKHELPPPKVEKPKEQPKRLVVTLPPFAWLESGKTMRVFDGIIPPDAINNDDEYKAYSDQVAALEMNTSSLSLTQVGFIQKVAQLLKAYEDISIAKKSRVVRIKGRVFTLAPVTREEKALLIEQTREWLLRSQEINVMQLSEIGTRGQPFNTGSFYLQVTIETRLSNDALLEQFRQRNLFAIVKFS